MDIAYSWTSQGFSLMRLTATVLAGRIVGSLAVAMGDYGFPPFWSEWHPRVHVDARYAHVYLATKDAAGNLRAPYAHVGGFAIPQEQGAPLEVYPLAGSFVELPFDWSGTIQADSYLMVLYTNSDGQVISATYHVPYVVAVDEPDVGDDPISVIEQTTGRAIDRIADILFGDLAARLGVDPYQLMVVAVIAAGVLVLALALR